MNKVLSHTSVEVKSISEIKTIININSPFPPIIAISTPKLTLMYSNKIKYGLLKH